MIGTDRSPRVAPAGASFGEALRRHRLAADATQEELAERAELSVRAISDLERGVHRSPRRATARSLARALGLTEDECRDFEALAQPVAGHGGAAADLPLPPTPLVIEGMREWPETGQFVIAGQANPDGTFLMTDDAPERLGFRRGVYQGTIAPDGSVSGSYFEQTQEQSSWEFVAQRSG